MLSLVIKGTEQKVPILIIVPNLALKTLRIVPKLLEDFSCFVSRETGITENSPKIPASFQFKIPRQLQRNNSQKFPGEQAREMLSH